MTSEARVAVKTKTIDFRCAICGAWSPSPFFIVDSASLDAAMIAACTTSCSRCGNTVACNKENMRATFDDGSVFEGSHASAIPTSLLTRRIEDKTNFAVPYIEMFFNKTKLSSGSGFFWRSGSQTFLVTNWHNVTGRNPETGECLSKTAAIPNYLKLTLYRRATDAAADPEGQYFAIRSEVARVPLYGPDESPNWIEHPEHGRNVDVVLIPVNLEKGGYFFQCANDLYPGVNVAPAASDDAFVLGYPLGVVAKLPIPIWKRATIATEPSVEVDDLPKLLLDTATRSGMSGSLVLVKNFIFGPFEAGDGKRYESEFAIRNSILGVYSGRLGAHEVEAQLGVVWKVRVIEEILRGAGWIKGQVFLGTE